MKKLTKLQYYKAELNYCNAMVKTHKRNLEHAKATGQDETTIKSYESDIKYYSRFASNAAEYLNKSNRSPLSN